MTRSMTSPARPLRVLFAHCRYQERGGEDVVLENEMALLAANGHEVDLFCLSNDSIRSTWDKMRTALGATYDRGARRQLGERVARFRPDILHVHNFFPLLSPSVYDAAAEAGVPVVQTLHNFRITCANPDLTRGLSSCDLCVTGNAYLWATRYRCYRHSFLGSLAVAHMIETHRSRHTWTRKIGHIICLSDYMRAVFMRYGIPPSHLSVVRNFCFDAFGTAPAAPPEGPPSALFVGRLTQNKGVEMLIEAWQDMPYRLDIAGTGPLASRIAAAAPPNVRLLGFLDAAALRQAYRAAALLVVPSLRTEGGPLSLIEAMSAGLPVVISDWPPHGEFVEDEQTGRIWRGRTATGLHQLLRGLLDAPEMLWRMGVKGRETFERRFAPERHYEQLIDIYTGLGVRERAGGG